MYCERCRTRIISGVTCTTCGHVNPGQAQAPQSGPPPAAGNPGMYLQPVPGVLSPSGPFQKPISGAVTLVVIAVIGAISPWLPYIPDGYPYQTGGGYASISGWRSRWYFDRYAQITAGPILVLLGSLVALGLGIAVLVSQSQSKPINKVAVGVPTIVGGLMVMLGAGISYNAWDTILEIEDVTSNQGVGLLIGLVAGVGLIVMGILMLTVRKLTQGTS